MKPNEAQWIPSLKDLESWDHHECSNCGEFAISETQWGENWDENYIEQVLFQTYASIKKRTYICSECGEIIFPDLVVDNSGMVNVQFSNTNIRGGKGNEVIKSNVCDECVRKYMLGG